MIVYFDTNVFDNLIKKENNVTASDEKALRNAINERKICVALSFINLEEAVFALKKYPEEAEKKFRIFSELSDCHKMIKTPKSLLLDDLSSFVKSGKHSGSFFIDSPVKINLRELHNSNRIEELLGVINRIDEEKRNFKLENIQSKKEFLALSKQYNYTPSFDQYWDSHKLDFARVLVEEAGMKDKYKYNNIDRLLDIRSVRLCVGWEISYIYGLIFEKLKCKPSDSRDVKHAVSASVADIFVTHDGDLANLLKRIKIDDFKVFSHLHELLNII